MADAQAAQAKYNEYKTKLAAWARLFEEEYGEPPSDSDCHQSSTWTALNEKARFYKKLLQNGTTDRSFGKESSSTPPFRSSSRKDGVDTRRAQSNTSRRDRGDSPAHSRPPRAHDGERSTRKSHRKAVDPSPSGGHDRERDSRGEQSMRRKQSERRRGESPETRRGAGRGGTSRRERSTSRQRTARDGGTSRGGTSQEAGGSPSDDDPLPSLPEASEALRKSSEFIAVQTRAKDTLEKLKKWERAFERDYGSAPSADDKRTSNTYTAYKRKYKQFVSQMQQLIDAGGGAEERASSSSAGGGGATGSGDAGSGDADVVEDALSAMPEVVAVEASASGGGKGPNRRRSAVSAESSQKPAADDVDGEHEPDVVPKSKEATSFLNEALRKVLLFSSLSDNEYNTIVGAMFEVKVSAGQMLINEGEQGDNFYVVQTGSYSVFLKKLPGKAVKSYGPGDSFGDLALLYNTPRAASIKCTQSGTLWALDRATFRVILMSQKQSSDHTMLEFLRSIPLFSSLTTEQCVRVASVVNVLKFSGGEHVVRQGDHADSIYLIKEGSVVCSRRGEEDKYPLHMGDVFGESALNEDLAEEDRARRADVVADGPLSVVQLMQADFNKLLGSSLDAVARKNLNLKIMAAVKFDGTALTTMLSSADLDKLVDALQEETFQDGESVVEEGSTGDTFYIIKNGAATVSTKQRGDLATLTEGDFFGEMALLRAEPRAASIAAQGVLKCLTLNRITFTRLLGPLQERLALEMDRRELQMGTIKFADLEPIKLIGSGSFAFVRLVLHRPSNVTYALKTMYRGSIIKLNQVEHILSEAKILKRCAHPFLPRLAATYKDADALYILMDFVPGGELFSVLRAQHRFLEPVAAFYAAIVVLCFEYLHDRRIVYRDLKPENLLFDAQGYLKLVDFGFAKEVVTKTWTLCGTPEYLAPEIVLNKGHDRCADWWALGILVYEMLVGTPPFTDDHDPMQIYQKVLKGSVPEPKGQRPLGKEAKEVVNKLLAKDVNERLGCQKNGCEEVKRAPFFSKLNWHRLEKKLIQPPYVPEVADPFDVSNFETDGLSTPRNDYKSAAHAGTAHLFEDF